LDYPTYGQRTGAVVDATTRCFHTITVAKDRDNADHQNTLTGRYYCTCPEGFTNAERDSVIDGELAARR